MREMITKTRKGLFIVFGILSLLVITGCGVEYETNSDGEQVKDENGARVVTNQITEDTSFSEVWDEDGWFGALLVYPLVKLITFVGELLSSYGLAIIISTFLVRLATLPLTLKSSKQQKKQRELQPKVQKIRDKYADKKDRDSQMRMNAEVQKLYKDNNVSMLGGCLGLLVTMPLFFAFYAAIYRTPGIFNDPFIGFALDVTPRTEIMSNGHYLYAIPIIVVFALNFFSMQFTQSMNKPEKSDVKRAYNANREKNPNMMEQQMKLMKYFMPIMMAFISLGLPVGVSVYFMSSSLFSIFQSFVVKKVA